FKGLQRGVVVAEVQEGSSAAKAGIEPGDVVVSVDGKVVDSSAQLRNEIGARRIGESVKLTLLREGKSRSLKVKIGESASVANATAVHRFLEGARLQDDERGRGVVVADIGRGTPAAATGLQV